VTRAFPEMEGSSPRSLKCRQRFAGAWSDECSVHEVLAQLPWYSPFALVEKLEAPGEQSQPSMETQRESGEAEE
jgi:hypothetical protein